MPTSGALAAMSTERDNALEVVKRAVADYNERGDFRYLVGSARTSRGECDMPGHRSKLTVRVRFSIKIPRDIPPERIAKEEASRMLSEMISRYFGTGGNNPFDQIEVIST